MGSVQQTIEKKIEANHKCKVSRVMAKVCYQNIWLLQHAHDEQNRKHWVFDNKNEKNGDGYWNEEFDQTIAVPDFSVNNRCFFSSISLSQTL